MKRTQFINLDFMRKITPSFRLKPLALGVSAALLASCGSSKEEVVFVTSVDDCEDNTELSAAQCNTAYQQALAEAQRTGPKYRSMNLCESEFGDVQCMNAPDSNFFMPLMAGFLINQMLFDRDRHYYGGYYNPVYRYYRPYSRYHDALMLADGTSIGKFGSKKKFKVSKSATKKKPTVTKTVSRGGFGSVASAKSSWGGGKSSSKGWGG